jgi:phospholipid/cholesterol/gamma-HCH transport system ATP-binding protein
MNAQAPTIEFRNVVLSFGDNVALNDVSFTLHQGEMILMTGASGSGKSVLLRLTVGLLKPDSGQILIEGEEIQTLNESAFITLRGVWF